MAGFAIHSFCIHQSDEVGVLRASDVADGDAGGDLFAASVEKIDEERVQGT